MMAVWSCGNEPDRLTQSGTAETGADGNSVVYLQHPYSCGDCYQVSVTLHNTYMVVQYAPRITRVDGNEFWVHTERAFQPFDWITTGEKR